LITFIIGTGSTCAVAADPAEERDTGLEAAAFAAASETPRIALAPSRDLFCVPSSSISACRASLVVGVEPADGLARSPLDVAHRLDARS
jgi:hypothetical protein